MASILLLMFNSILSQNYSHNHQFARSEYVTIINGKEELSRGKIITYSVHNIVQIHNEMDGKKFIPETPKETGYIDYTGKSTIQIADFADGQRISTVNLFEKLPKFEILPDTETIAGYLCQKARAVVFSNNIEIWFTKNAGIKGSPVLGYVLEDALIMKVLRNGSFEIRAKLIDLDPEMNFKAEIPDNLGQLVEMHDYRQMISSAFIKTLNIFSDEQIYWGNKTPNPENRDSLNVMYQFAGGTVILKKIRLPEVPSDASLFIELTQFSNGDAYDRTGSVFLVPTVTRKSFLSGFFDTIADLPSFTAKNGKKYQGMLLGKDFFPIVELLRFFTPFGIRHYNDKVKISKYKWHDSVTFKQEITDLLPLLQNEQWIGIYIGNYDGGGHKVSLKLDFHLNHKELQAGNEELAFWLPLFNTTNILEMAGQEYGTLFESDTLSLWFDLPEGITDLKLRYLSTGHGGWENGDEFVPRENLILIDGKEVYKYTPWRTDCASYRLYNPASGNFWNGLSSSDYSRSGWCPGTATNPIYIPIQNCSAGRHKIQVHIPQGKPEGGSFSSWNISGVLLGKMK